MLFCCCFSGQRVRGSIHIFLQGNTLHPILAFFFSLFSLVGTSVSMGDLECWGGKTQEGRCNNRLGIARYELIQAL